MKRARVAIFAVVGVVAAAQTAAGAGPVRVAILPVVVHAQEGHEYLRGGMADMLASRIGRHPGVEVRRVRDVKLATIDPGKAREAARTVGAEFVVYGSFTAFGTGASLDLECTATGDGENRSEIPVRDVFVHAASLGDIIPELDGLANKVARYAASRGRDRSDVAAPPPGRGNGTRPSTGDIQSILERVEALERVVFSAPKPAEKEPPENEPVEREPEPMPEPAPAEPAVAPAPEPPPVDLGPEIIEEEDVRDD